MRTLALSLALASTVLADEVVLKNGSAFSGVVREEGDRVVVEMDFGTMTFKRVDVRSISKGNDPYSEFETRAKTATDVKGLLELAVWAKGKGLGTKSTELYRKVLSLDPDQADARKALGYEKVAGQWLTGDDLMVARGFVKRNGRWLAKDTAERLLEQDELARQENDRIDLEKKLADQRHEEEMTRIGLERDRLEAEKLDRDFRWWWRNGWAYSPAPFCGVAGYLLPSLPPPAAL
ncbi:MAG TPA: hypothetical protein VKU80_16195, partial [Planctomycetota bacterium]|nr:hypothetical protein [Planctomycetota bacterium]